MAPAEVTLGARGDSYYEYLLKQWLLTNRTEPVYLDEYRAAVASVNKYLQAPQPTPVWDFWRREKPMA